MADLKLRGFPASEGIAIGPAHRFRAPDRSIPPRKPGPLEDEWRRFEGARRAAAEEIAGLRRRIAHQAGERDAAIFDAHAMMLEDPLLADRVRTRLTQGAAIERAVAEAISEVADQLARMTDETFATRAADVRDVGDRLVRILLGRPAIHQETLKEPAVILADDLTPSDTAGLNPAMTLGFCTAAGGVTSHTAILARTLGLPAVVGVGESSLEQIGDGDEVIVDGFQGVVWARPSPHVLEESRQHQDKARRRAAECRAAATREGRTSDGRRIEVAANVGDVASVWEATAQGAEGIGLLRTELLYLQATRPPEEEDQRHTYEHIFTAIGARPVIVRTLDVGGDKPPKYLDFPQELNPFLGWRAVRVSLDRTDLFTIQIRAILRAAVGHDVRIMLPMISGLEEIRQARALVAGVEKELEREGIPFSRGVPLGIMVETPAAAVFLDVLASEADFFSLGTNDLTQYALAVDRGNSRVASLFQPLHPAVLRLVRTAIDSAHRADKWIGMCGELASMRKAIPILVGFGIDELSMAPGSIPEAKALIARLESGQARRLAEEALALGTAVEVETRMDRFLDDMGWHP